MAIALGIDLGTTYTVAAVVQDGRPRVVPNAEGQSLTPSVVAFTKAGGPLVGQTARQQATANPRATVFSIKRHMGSDYKMMVGERAYTPQEVSSFILSKVKADVQAHLGSRVDKAVITVPAYFNDRQRQATKEAGCLAGLDVIRIVSEPTAAALAYGIDREDAHTVLVWDLGGGTFDVSILALGGGIFEVRAVSGDTWLGGDDYDRRLMEHLALECRRRHGVEIAPDDGTAWVSLREAAERAKVELSTATTVQVRLPFGPGNRHLDLPLTRERLQELTTDLVERMAAPTRQALADAGLEPRHIDRVILVGGATRMPAVRDKARELLGQEPYRYIDPDQVVAMGAAIQAGVLLGAVSRAVLLDVLPLSLGIEAQGGLFARIIPRNSPLPASEGRIFTTAADGQASVDVHVLQGEREMALHNVSLGRLRLDGIPPLPRGAPRLEVAFDVDADGIVHVSATDLFTNCTQGTELVSSKTLCHEEIEGVISESVFHTKEDNRHREGVSAGIIANNAIAAAEAQVAALERAVQGVREALASGDAGEIKDRSAALWQLLRSSAGPMRSSVSR